MIPESFIQDLLARVDIVDLIDGYVPLKKAGANFAACCPFHNEKSPSFTVSPSKQFYHCFGCGAHGTAIGFLMEYSGLGFVDTIKDLAGRVGMQVPEESHQPRREGPASSDLVELMGRAARYYRDSLKHSQRAIEYLKSRGLTGEIAVRFGVGYAPDGWQNLQAVFSAYDQEALQTAGLVIKNDNGRLYDRFRDRIMFPIHNQKGELIAFGGRVLDAGEPKYLNSPETPLFEKGRELFGLPQARQALREHDTAIVVEGYMDVVALAQHGVGNAVATLGTATTPTHVQKLFRLVDRIVFCFDGDAAGRKAAWRALENALDAAADNKRLAFAFLPSEHDPDSFVREHGADAFRRYLDNASPLSEYLLQELARRADPGTAEGAAQLLHEAKPLLARLSSPALRLQIVKRLGEMARASAGEVEKLCELKPLASFTPMRRAPKRAPSLLRTIGTLLLHHPDFAARLPEDLLPSDNPEAAALRDIQTCCLQVVDHLAGAADASPDASAAGTLGGTGAAGTVGGAAGTFGGAAGASAALVERLQAGPHAAWARELYGEVLAHTLQDHEAETEFAGAVQQLRAGRLLHELDALQAQARAGTLDASGKRRYVELLQEKSRAAQRGQDS